MKQFLAVLTLAVAATAWAVPKNQTLDVSPAVSELYSGIPDVLTFSGCGNTPGDLVCLIVKADPPIAGSDVAGTFCADTVADANGCFSQDIGWTLGGSFTAYYMKTSNGVFFKPGFQGVSANFVVEYELYE
jgi:hypothetical protein